jgi:glycosyltransferase involved in cell wall biosynthesis
VKFSIITPSFNSLAYLPRCIGSIKNQTYRDVEHIVVDGASRDGTVDWLSQRYVKTADAKGERHGKSLAWFSEPDQGMYDAIHKGWGRARGDVLAWLNCDEQYLPETLSCVQRAFADHPDVDVLFGDSIIIAPDGQPLAARREIPLRAIYVRNGFLYALSCTMFFRRRLWDSGLLRFDLQYKLAGDMDTILTLMEHGIKAWHLPCYLALFTADGGNLSTQPGMELETRKIRRAHGAFPSRMAQRLILCGRYVERILQGCYLPKDLSYQYVMDDTPASCGISSKRVGWRFSYARAVRQIKEHIQ